MNNTIESAVGVLIINEKGELLLVKSFKEFDQWVIPGGHINYGENSIDCAKREAREEVHLDLHTLKFLNIKESITKRRNTEGTIENRHFIFINYVAKLTNSVQKVVVDNRELQDYAWMDPKKALKFKGVSKDVREIITFYLKN